MAVMIAVFLFWATLIVAHHNVAHRNEPQRRDIIAVNTEGTFCPAVYVTTIYQVQPLYYSEPLRLDLVSPHLTTEVLSLWKPLHNCFLLFRHRLKSHC
jgi:hypothetical protein